MNYYTLFTCTGHYVCSVRANNRQAALARRPSAVIGSVITWGAL